MDNECEEVVKCISSKVTEEQNTKLLMPVEEDSLKKHFFTCILKNRQALKV